MWKVLIADDEPLIIRSIIRRIQWEEMDLELAGTAENGDELLEKIKTLQPDLVITDICMPAMTGLEVIAKSFELENPPRFIITSAYTTFEYARTAIRLGVDEYLPKPVTSASIREALENSLKKLRQSRKPEQKKNLFIDTACQYIEANFQKQLQLKDVAQEVYLSPSYFSSLFKAETGMNFLDYLTKIRMEHAKIWLKDPQYSQNDVAAMCGYSSSKYFGKVFKAETGMTPGEWRHGKSQSGE